MIDRSAPIFQDIPRRSTSPVPGALATVDEVGADSANAHLYNLERHADATGQSIILLRVPGGDWTVALGDGLAPRRVLTSHVDHDEAVTAALRRLEREAR